MAAFTLEGGEVITVLEHWSETRAPDLQEAPSTGEDSVNAKASPPVTAQPTTPTHHVKKKTPAVSETEPGQGEKIEPPVQEPSGRARFLHDIHAGGCQLFGTVLGPLANEAHKDHFHFDLAPRKHSNYCE